MKKGIDVSYAQGNINWGHVNTDFAIIRAGYGREVSQKDAQFENNYTGCKSNDIPCGAYWYSHALDVEDAKKEANACISVLKGKTFEYPIYFDIEDPSQSKLSMSQVSAICKAFCDEMEKAGYWVGIYSFASWMRDKISSEVCKRYAVWVAHTGVAKPNYNGNYGIWQYSHTGHTNGIQGKVDMNYAYIDYPSKIKANDLNGFKKTAEAKTPEAKKSYTKGTKLTLKNVKLYCSATDKTCADTISGTYYIYDGENISGRYRITNAKSNVSKTPIGQYVTGFIDKADV